MTAGTIGTDTRQLTTMLPGETPMVEDFSSLWKCFPPEEARRLRDALALLPHLDARPAEEIREVIRMAVRTLPPVAEAIGACPSALGQQQFGSRIRTAESLIDALCRSEIGIIELEMPTGAILGRAFVIAKLNFFKALSYALESAGQLALPAATQIKDTISDTIFSKLAEELLTAAISNPHNALDLKRAAAQKLLGMWSNRLQVPVGEFPPVLLSAWKARVKVRAMYGTLMGVGELFSLIQQECESRFVNYFVREHVTSDEKEAFQEFLFGLSHEEIGRLRAHMKEHHLHVISPEQVKQILFDRVLPPTSSDPSPEHIYSSYCRRRLRADYRAMSGIPGPKKTAEGYMMESILREER